MFGVRINEIREYDAAIKFKKKTMALAWDSKFLIHYKQGLMLSFVMSQLPIVFGWILEDSRY